MKKTAIICTLVVVVAAVIIIRATRHPENAAFMVAASAVDVEEGVKLPVQVGALADGTLVPLASVVASYSSNSLRHEWMDSTQRQIFVYSPGYCTQSFVVVGSTNITAILVRL